MSFFDGAKLLLFCYSSYFLLFKNAKNCAFYCFFITNIRLFYKNKAVMSICFCKTLS